MPEGHTVHRLARALERGFGGERLRISSPQGRFPEAAEIDRHVLLAAEAVGKHLFLSFAPQADLPLDSVHVRIVHVHLGLYGSWTFAGEHSVMPDRAIGAPRRAVDTSAVLRVGEQEHTVTAGSTRDLSETIDPEGWRRLLPRPTVRLRLVGPHGLADLTGPTACEILDAEGRERIMARLGPDPLRDDADPRRFIQRVLRSRTGIGVQLMNQDVIAGVGNIYRAEVLFRARLSPFVPGTDLTAGILEGIWDDLAVLMDYGARTGRIVTTQPEHRDIAAMIIERSRGTRQNGDEADGVVPREKSFYVYHRQTLPCRLCGAEVRSEDLASRTVFWCPRCQTERSRRSPWTRQNPAESWALPD